MTVLQGYKPEKVFEYFETLCEIPHGSGNTTRLSNWLVDFAKALNLEYYQDEMENVIIIKEASAGYENRDPVILQGHIDMVCDKDEDCHKDMEKEGLDLAIDGDKLYAVGTTLGGDDGIAVAYMLALLADDGLSHPRIEAVFTTEEETGLYGAEAIDVAPLTGKKFINLDSEEEGIVTVGCAGGVTAVASIPVSREKCEGTALEVRLSGFHGGHSGSDITMGQENALKVMGRLLYELQKETDARLLSVDGGVADNAIPPSGNAVVVSKEPEKVNQLIARYEDIFAHEFKVDRDFKITVSPIEGIAKNYNGGELSAMDAKSSESVIAYLIGTPNGIEKMTLGMDKLPQTSLSMGILETKDDSVEFTFCIRSSVDSECDMLARRLQCQAEVLGGEVTFEGRYPGWEYVANSPLRDLVCEVYKEQTGKEMVIEAIHAGLECGYFASKIPGLDCVSIGPDIENVHTPKEVIYISSIQRTWELLVEVLRRL